jgi:hypothetical protein
MRPLARAIPTALLALHMHAQVKPSAAIPATSVTQSVSNVPSAHPLRAGSAIVTWSNTQLTIQGQGDSLHNILQAVSQATGLKVTGGVPEEPVFGNYGPGNVQDVLPQLFDGISVNMMLVNDGASRPGELLLTQRTGAATPPQVRPIADEDQGFRRRRNAPAPQIGVPPTPPPGFMPPNQSGAMAPGQPAGPNAGSPATTTGTDATGQPESPNGVRTPEQIFEELRKRQQQQQSATPQ